MASPVAPSKSKQRQVKVASGSGAPVSFMIVPHTLGNIPIKVTATTDGAVDVVVKQLLVKVGARARGEGAAAGCHGSYSV